MRYDFCQVLQENLFQFYGKPQYGYRMETLIDNGVVSLRIENAPIQLPYFNVDLNSYIKQYESFETDEEAYQYLAQFFNEFTVKIINKQYLPEITRILNENISFFYVSDNDIYKMSGKGAEYSYAKREFDFEMQRPENLSWTDDFDRPLVVCLEELFCETNFVHYSIESKMIEEGRYAIECEFIPGETDSTIGKFHLVYDKENENYESQIHLTNIFLDMKLQQRGIATNIINRLFDYCGYCSFRGTFTTLWITNIVNHTWEEHLMNKGAIWAYSDRWRGDMLAIIHKL